MGEPVYRIVGTAQRAELDEHWRIIARIPVFDQEGWEAFFAVNGEQYGRVYLLPEGTGPDVPTFPEDFAPKRRGTLQERREL